ncbi:MAG: VPLPA-CTERM sorting domain-containing protein [Pseudomonadota bacterium]
MITFVRKTATVIAALILISATTSTVNAASISLVPSSSVSLNGDTATFDLIANFGSDLTVGGATDFMWDASVLQFDDFVFGAALAAPVRDVFFDVFDLQSPSLFSIGFGNFAGVSLPTDTVIGTISFMVIGAAGSSTGITLADSIKWSGFLDLIGDSITVDYSGTTANVVPLPAGAWLLLSGLGGLVALRRRRRQ